MQGLWGDLFTVCRAIKEDPFSSPKYELKFCVWPFPHGAEMKDSPSTYTQSKCQKRLFDSMMLFWL